MNCNVCQTPNDDHARFCRHCGTQLPTAGAPLPPPTASGSGDPLWAATRGTDPNGQNWETLVPTERSPGPTAGPTPTMRNDVLPTATDIAAVRATGAGIQPDLRLSVAAGLAERRRRRRIAVIAGCAFALLAAAVAVIVVLAADDGGSTASPDTTAALTATPTTVTTAPPAPVTTFLTVTTLPTATTVPVTTPATTTTLAPTTTVAPTTVVVVVPPVVTTVPGSTTTPTTAVPTTPPATTSPATTAPATTTAPTVPANGDLGLDRPITKPACDGKYITLVGSSVDPDGYRLQVGNLLDRYPDAEYLRTESVCSSLRAKSAAGDSIYVVYLGPFASKQQACNARPAGSGAYVKVLDNTSNPATGIDCG
jgi:hypothetical protein